MKIQQRKSKSVVGKTSLFVSFDYNAKIVEIIKSFSGRDYSKRTKEWEIPLIYLSELIDKCIVIEDIELELLGDPEQKEHLKPKLSKKYKLPLFNHQLEGVEYGLNHPKWLLLDAPGLGKTAQIIHLAEELKHQKNIKHCLIICGVATLKTNWEAEIAKHSDLSCTILGKKTNSKGNITYGSVKEREDQLNSEIKEFFIITNVETLVKKEIVKAILNGPNEIDMIVLDEAHRCKDPSSKRGANLLKLNKAPYRIALTGTLLMNNPLDSFVPLKWIGEENCGVTNYKNFYLNYLDGFNFTFKNIPYLKEVIKNCSLRRTKDLLNLPPKIINEELLDMDDPQAQFYNSIKNSVKEDYKGSNERIKDRVNKVILNTSSVLALVARLRQATASPSMLTTENIPSAKLDRAVDLAEEIVAQGEKVIIFSVFKEPLNVLKERLSNYSPLLCTGDVGQEDIDDNIRKFQNDPSYPIILCTTAKMGTGITLTAASYEIFLDIPWTQALYDQCQDRAYRIGTKKTLIIYQLTTKGTIDEKVSSLVKAKGAISDYIIDDKVAGGMLEELIKYIEEL